MGIVNEARGESTRHVECHIFVRRTWPVWDANEVRNRCLHEVIRPALGQFRTDGCDLRA